MGEGNPIYMNGLYFALQSGVEHQNLHNNPCQIQETLFDVHMLKTFLKKHPGDKRQKNETLQTIQRNVLFIFKKKSIDHTVLPIQLIFEVIKNTTSNCWYLVRIVKTNHSLPGPAATHRIESGVYEKWNELVIAP